MSRRELLRCICTVVGLWLIVMAAAMTAHVAQSGTDALGWRILIPATVGAAYLTIELPYLRLLLPRKRARKKPLLVGQTQARASHERKYTTNEVIIAERKSVGKGLR